MCAQLPCSLRLWVERRLDNFALQYIEPSTGLPLINRMTIATTVSMLTNVMTICDENITRLLFTLLSRWKQWRAQAMRAVATQRPREKDPPWMPTLPMRRMSMCTVQWCRWQLTYSESKRLKLSLPMALFSITDICGCRRASVAAHRLYAGLTCLPCSRR